MAMTEQTINKCLRCGHKWPSRTERIPQRCARCNSPYWNIPKVKKNLPNAAKQTSGRTTINLPDELGNAMKNYAMINGYDTLIGMVVHLFQNELVFKKLPLKISDAEYARIVKERKNKKLAVIE